MIAVYSLIAFQIFLVLVKVDGDLSWPWWKVMTPTIVFFGALAVILAAILALGLLPDRSKPR